MTTPGSGRSSIGVRVRPNSDNFIRDLKAQLAAKKATYWVDVKANLKPANKDILDWSKSLKTWSDAKIPLQASMIQATKDVNRWRSLQRDIKTNIPIGVDTTAATRELAAWRRNVKRDLEIPVKIDVSQLRSAIARAAKMTVKADLDVDTDPVERKLSGLFLPGGKFKTIKLDADTSDIDKEIDKVKAKVKADPPKTKLELDVDEAQRKLRKLRIQEAARRLGVTINVDADPKKAELQLKLLRARAAARDLELKVGVKKNSIESVFKALRSVEKQFGSLTVLRSLDLGPITLGKPTGLIGTLATLTTLAGLIPGIVTGLAALSDGFLRLAGAAAIAPGAIGGIVASLATFALATSGVGDTISSMFDLWNEGASEQRATANSLVSAHNSYRNAVVDEAKAQRDVGRARRDALGDLRDLNNELRGGVLNEAQAILDTQKARDRYAQQLQEGFASETDRQQLILDIAKADQSLAETREHNIRTQQKANDANAQGVEGSDRVTDALEAQTRAAQATAQAATALAEAEGNGTSAAQKFADQLGLLSPNAKEFVLAISGMKGEIQGFKSELQDVLFQGLGPALTTTFHNLLPIIGPGMREIAQAMNQNILTVFDSLSSPGGKSIIERILGGTADMQKSLNGLIDPLVRGVGTLVAAGSEHLPQVVELMTRLADRFANFIETADKNGTLDKFMDEGIKAIGDLAETGINLVKIAQDFAKAFRSAFGKDIFQTIRDITAEWHTFLSSKEGQQDLLEFIAEAKDLWEEWKPVLKELPGVFKAVGDGAKAVLDVVLPFLREFAQFAKDHPALVSTFIGSWLGAKVLIGALSPVLTILRGLLNTARAIPAVANALAKVPGVGPALAGPKAAPGGGTVGGGGKGGLGNALKPVRGGLPTSVQSGGALPGGPAGPGAAPPAAPGASGTAAGGGAGALAKILGPLAIGATAILEIKNESDLSRVYDEWKKQRAELPEDQRRQFDKDFYAGIGIDIGDAGPYPELSKFFFKSQVGFAQKTGQQTQLVVKDGQLFDAKTGELIPSFEKGGMAGYTNWPKMQGSLAMLHGHEYIQPADTTSHYGVDVMEAIHQRRVPKDLLKSFSTGVKGYKGKASAAATKYGFEGGGHYDPNTGQWVPDDAPTVTNAMQPNPAGGPGILGTVIQGGINAATHGASVGIQAAQGVASGVGTGPAPGPDIASGAGTGPAPGPADTFGIDTSGGQIYGDKGGTGSINLFGINIPLPNTPQHQNRGWGPGGAPQGLGGGDAGPNGAAPFDIRKFGIGPGPPGSGPDDWLGFLGQQLGTFGSNLLTSFAQGALDFVGLGGILQSPYLRTAAGLTSHFLSPDQGTTTAGATGANADVASLLQTYSGMPGNPDYPGVPNLPDVFDPATGSAVNPNGPGNGGLQINTLRGKEIIQRMFPWATNIGGVRADRLKWHPQGLALDVMIPGAGGLNDPTPPEGKAEGDQLYNWLNAHKQELGIDYILWQEKDHYNHLHVNFAASGYPPGGGPSGLSGSNGSSAAPSAPSSTGWFPPGTTAPAPKPPVLFPAPYPGQNGSLFGDQPHFEVGGLMPMGNVDPDQFSGGWNRSPGVGSHAGTVLPGSGPPTGMWQGPEHVPPDRAWPGPLPGASVPGTPGDAGIGHKIWDILPGIRPQSPVPSWMMPPPGHAIMDRGGWLMPGTTVVHNFTGKPELVVPGYEAGGFAAGLPIIPKPFPRPPDAQMIKPKPPPIPPPPPAAIMPPQAAIPPVTPSAPPMAPSTPPGGTPPPGQDTGRQTNAVAIGPAPIQPPDLDAQMHLHPAIVKGIQSGAAVAGNLASSAISMGMGAAGLPGGGAAGQFVAGLIQQGGKIATNIANIGASFLVGNVTGGTTSNAYGVTQHGSSPSGGTRVIDASNNQYGDVYTNNLDEYFARMKRRDDQRAQVTLGNWGR